MPLWAVKIRGAGNSVAVTIPKCLQTDGWTLGKVVLVSQQGDGLLLRLVDKELTDSRMQELEVKA